MTLDQMRSVNRRGMATKPAWHARCSERSGFFVHDRGVRWLVILGLVLTARTADARRLVISDPPMVRKCPKGKTWQAVMSCLAQHSTPKVAQSLRGAKLVTLFQKNGKGQLVDHGVLLYVERGGGWQIGGRFETYGGEYAVLQLAPIKIGKRTGFRLDIGLVSPFTLMVDNISPVPAQLRTRRSMFCSGDSYACPEAVTTCEVTVDGQAWHVFHGALSFADNAVVVDGDRSRAGAHCQVSAKVYLGWTQR